MVHADIMHVRIMHTSNWLGLFKNCLGQRNLKSEKGSGAMQTCMCLVSTNKNIAVLVLGIESKFWILIFIHCLDTEKCNSKQKLTQEGEKMKCGVLVQVRLFKKEKLKKHFWQLKCYVGLQSFLEYASVSQSILFVIKLNHRQPF